MELTRKERRLILSYETRLRYANNLAEIAFCKQQIESIIRKAKERLEK